MNELNHTTTSATEDERTAAVVGAWGVDGDGHPVHLPSFNRGIAFNRAQQLTHINYRIVFPGTGLPVITGLAEKLSEQLARGLAAAPTIWSLAVLEQQTTISSFEKWTVAVCDPAEYRHLGPWKRAFGFSEVEECEACHSQIGK